MAMERLHGTKTSTTELARVDPVILCCRGPRDHLTLESGIAGDMGVVVVTSQLTIMPPFWIVGKVGLAHKRKSETRDRLFGTFLSNKTS